MTDRAASADGRDVPSPGEDVSCALALVNTRRMDAGQPVDLIADASQAAEWLARQGLLPHGSRVDDREAGHLVALREATRALFTARAERRSPAADVLSPFNAALALAPAIPALAWDARGPHQSDQPLAPGADLVSAAIARIARDGLRVLTTAGGPEPAPCGAHGCIRWFLRTHAARQWCSDRCGDRVRAARHYARRHNERRLGAQVPVRLVGLLGLRQGVQPRAQGR